MRVSEDTTTLVLSGPRVLRRPGPRSDHRSTVYERDEPRCLPNVSSALAQKVRGIGSVLLPLTSPRLRSLRLLHLVEQRLLH